MKETVVAKGARSLAEPAPALAFPARGFLPAEDPARAFSLYPQLGVLDEIGRDLPSLLHDRGFRARAGVLAIPEWPEDRPCAATLPELRLYYLRLGFLASAYVNQVPEPRARLLPRNLAVPLAKACRLLGRPPILSYDGYALYNWKRFDPQGPIALGNIDTLQNFVHLYDEHWFILVHVEIEAIGGEALQAMGRAHAALASEDREGVDGALGDLADAVWRQVAVLRRIPEKMDPSLYYRTFRPYIRFFEDVVYEDLSEAPASFRGETGAQSSLMPALVAFMKIRHRQSALTDHLADMKKFMPPEHRALIARLERMPSLRGAAGADAYNEVLEAMASFREVHHGWAHEYINKRVEDPRGTGGTPYMTWLRQLIEETRGHRIG
jgi:indoleamine 2,3-dioxygenase